MKRTNTRTFAIRGLRNTGRVVAGVFMSASAACAGGTASEDLGYLQDRARVMCHKRAECCDPNGLGDFDMEECIDSVSAFGAPTDFEEARDDERASFDADAAERCLSEVSVLECDGWSDALTGSPPPVCESIYRGLVPVGGACRNHYYCESLFCFREYDSETSSFAPIGECLPRAGLGAACEFGGCERGLTCAGSGVCVERFDGPECWAGTQSDPIELF